MESIEEQALRAFQVTGSRDALRDLLTAHQGRIYTVCIQVLRRPVDAEDAAQEVLLKLAEGARTAQDADELRAWVYRVSFRVAINHWHRRAAIRVREARSALERNVGSPLGDQERLALYEGLEKLDDAERSLLLEHYFEKVTLDDLGARRGVTGVAIWKRIDKAREKLKKLLLAAGFAAASGRVAEALESWSPAPAPPSLVSESFLSSILAGGVVMGTGKSAALIGVAVAVILLVAAMTVGAILYGQSRQAPSSHTGMTGQEAVRRSVEKRDQIPAANPATPDPAPAKPANSELLRKLGEYKTLFEAWQAEVRKGGPITVDFYGRAREWGVETQPLVFEDPATFLSFLRDPENEAMAEFLVGNALNRYLKDGPGWGVDHWKFGDLPKALTDGLLEILKTGRTPLRSALLAWMHFLQEPPPAFDEQVRNFLDDPDPTLQRGGIIASARGRPLDPGTLEKVRQIFEVTSDSGVRNAAIDAICRTNQQEVQNWIAEKLQANRDPASVQAMARAAYWRLSFLRTQDPSMVDSTELDRFAAGLGEAIAVQKDWFGFSMVVQAAMQLPSDRAIPVLEKAILHSHTAGEKQAVELVLGKFRAGPVRGNKVLELERDFRTQAATR